MDGTQCAQGFQVGGRKDGIGAFLRGVCEKVCGDLIGAFAGEIRLVDRSCRQSEIAVGLHPAHDALVGERGLVSEQHGRAPASVAEQMRGDVIGCLIEVGRYAFHTADWRGMVQDGDVLALPNQCAQFGVVLRRGEENGIDMTGHHLDSNVWLFDYRTDLTDALCEAVGVDLSRRVMTKAQMNAVMSAVKKPRS